MLPSKPKRDFRRSVSCVAILVTVTEKPSSPPPPSSSVADRAAAGDSLRNRSKRRLWRCSTFGVGISVTVTNTEQPSPAATITVTKKPSLPPLPPSSSSDTVTKKPAFLPPLKPTPPDAANTVTKKPLPPRPPNVGVPAASSAAAVKFRRRPSSEIVIDIPSSPKIHNDIEIEEKRWSSFNLSYPSLSRIASLFKTPNDQIPAAAVEEEERRDQGQQQLVDRIVKAKDLNSLRQLGGAEQVASLLNSNLTVGLVDPDTTTSSSISCWKTTTNPIHIKQLGNYLIKSCNSYTILLLLISASLSLVTGMVVEGPNQGWHEGVTILAVVVLIITFPAVAEFVRAKMIEKKLRKGERRVEVIRGGEAEMIQVSRVVAGDVVDLKEGDRVPGDGLFVASAGNKLMLNDPLASVVDWDHNPFLSSGFKVLEGNGRMLVTSVGTDTAIGKVMSNVSDAPYGRRTLLQSQIEGPTSCADKIQLCISILVTLVLFIRFLRRNQQVSYDNELPELKGRLKIEFLMKLLLVRPRGLVCVLTTSLTAVVIGFQHGTSLAITVSLLYWNQKVEESGHANPQNLSACGTMGLATAICIDVSGGVLCNETGFNFLEEMKSAVESLKGEVLNIILVSGDELEQVIAIAIQLGMHRPDDDHSDNTFAIVGEEFRKLVDSNERETMKKITVIGRCSPEDKLSVVQFLKQQLGHVVVFIGGPTLGDAAALKEADVGITVEIQSAEMDKICSDIVTSLSLLSKHGRCVYHNIQKFIQLQLTVCISGTLITAVSTMSLGQSSLTAVQLIWANIIVCTLGVMMMVMEPQSGVITTHQPKPTRGKSVMTTVMYRNIAVQVLYQASGLLILQFAGQEMTMIRGVDTTVIFNTFILCQVFNLFNAMELENKETFLSVVKSYHFLASLGGVLVMQTLLVQLATSLAVGNSYVRLNWAQWGFCFLLSALSWGFDHALRFICVLFSKLSAESASSCILLFARTPSPFVPFLVLCFSMFLISFSKAWTLS